MSEGANWRNCEPFWSLSDIQLLLLYNLQRSHQWLTWRRLYYGHSHTREHIIHAGALFAAAFFPRWHSPGAHGSCEIKRIQSTAQPHTRSRRYFDMVWPLLVHVCLCCAVVSNINIACSTHVSRIARARSNPIRHYTLSILHERGWNDCVCVLNPATRIMITMTKCIQC